MIPFILAVVGGYLLGDSTKKFAKGGIAKGDRVIWDNENAFIEDIEGDKVKLFINHPESHNKGKIYSRDKHFVVDINELRGKRIIRRKNFDDGGSVDKAEIDIYKEGRSTKVYYTKGDIGFDGKLKEYHSGRDLEMKFEPDYFDNKESEDYYDENHEDIEQEITDYYYSFLKISNGMKKGGKVKVDKYYAIFYDNEDDDIRTVDYYTKRPSESEIKKFAKYLNASKVELYLFGPTLRAENDDFLVEQFDFKF